MLSFLISIIKPLALDFIVKRAVNLVSKTDNIKEVATSAVGLMSKRSDVNIEDVAVDILIQVADVTPNKKDDKWIKFINEIRGDVRSLTTKIQNFRRDY